jgi:protocatechuate 3,4-dioxygenase beta subunit
MSIRVSPNTKVVYWAAEPTNGVLQFADKAYAGYNNAGVALSDQGGNVVLKVREPQPYTIPLGSMKPHIHFRECNMTGFLGPVKTVYFNGYVEGFRV